MRALDDESGSHLALRDARESRGMPVLRASATDLVLTPIVNAATEFIGPAGLPADGAEVGLHPDPEPGDHAVCRLQRLRRKLTLVGVIAAGVLGNLIGSWIAYSVGYYGRLDLLERNRLTLFNPKHLRRADG